MENNEMEDGQMFVVNYGKIKEMKNVPSCVKLAIYKYSEIGYMNVGKFFEELTDSDLIELSTIFDSAISSTEQECLSTAFAVSVTLAQLEGTFVEKSEDLNNFFKSAAMLTSIESLSRKGLVKVIRENMSFIEIDKPVVEITDMGRSIANQLKNQKGEQ